VPAGEANHHEERPVSDQSEDFAAMFEASVQAKPLEQGELVEGRIVAIGPEVALIDVGRKGEAVMDIAELKNAAGEFEVAVGDLVQAMVVSTSGAVTLSRKLSGAAASDQQFEAAFQSGLPVEGKVEREVKGGYEVRIGRRPRSVRFPRSTSAAQTRQRTKGMSTNSGSLSTRKAARTSSSAVARSSRTSSGRMPAKSATRSSPVQS
jgi:ribosomal protein S1